MAKLNDIVQIIIDVITFLGAIAISALLLVAFL